MLKGEGREGRKEADIDKYSNDACSTKPILNVELKPRMCWHAL